jgi:hypothetical protein
MVPPERESADPASWDALRDVVPRRAVLTELARGFLLVQATHPDRAVRFAARFVQEISDEARPARVDASRPVPAGRRRLGLGESGPVDPSNFPPRR